MKEVVDYVVASHGYSQRRACLVTRQHRSTQRKPSTRDPRRAPKYLFADNGSEFTGHLVDLWAYHHGVRIDFSRPGKPTDNAYIETFDGSLRDECLNVHWFDTIAQAKRLIEGWRSE